MSEQARIVVRLRTTIWADSKGIYAKKSLTFLRRQCEGFNFLAEDAQTMTAEEVFLGIVNLDECEDGIYEVVICNEKRDWETWTIDSYEYRLVAMGEVA